MPIIATLDPVTRAKVLERLSPKALRAATKRAIERALVTTRKEGAKHVTQRLALRAGTVKKEAIQTTKPTTWNLEGVLRVRGAMIPLHDFTRPVETRHGVAVTVTRGKRQTFARAFIAKSTRGTGEEVFWRAKEGGSLVGRHPIRMLLGPSIVQILSARARIASLQNTASRRFTEEFRREALRRTGLLAQGG